jgi:hypothetical protein
MWMTVWLGSARRAACECAIDRPPPAGRWRQCHAGWLHQKPAAAGPDDPRNSSGSSSTGGLAVARRPRARASRWSTSGPHSPIGPLGEFPLRDFDGDRGALTQPITPAEAHPGIAVLYTPDDRPFDWLRAGQALTQFSVGEGAGRLREFAPRAKVTERLGDDDAGLAGELVQRRVDRTASPRGGLCDQVAPAYRSRSTNVNWPAGLDGPTATGNRCSIDGNRGGAVNRLRQRTFDPLAVDHARLQPQSTASERAQRSTMHLQKTPVNRPRITSDFAESACAGYHRLGRRA